MRRAVSGLISCLAWGAWAAFFAWPLASLIIRTASLSGDAGWGRLLDPILLSKVGATAFQAGVSALLSGVLGILLGIALRRYPAAQAWLRVPFGIPTLAAVAAWTSLLRGSGIEYSLEAVILAHVVFNTPWVALAVAEAAASVPRVWDETARSLGAGPFWRLWMVWRPVIAPAGLGAMAQVFAFCSMSFVIVLVLGGGPPVETLETAIYSSVRGGALDLGMATRLALWLLLLSLAPWILVRFLLMRGVARGPSRPMDLRSQKSELERATGTPFWAWLLAGIWVLPYFAFFKEIDFGRLASVLDWGALRGPVFLSLGIAVTTAWVSVLWALLVLASGSRWLALLSQFPAGVSTLSLAMGFWLAYAQWADPFSGSLLALIAVQSLGFLPIVLRWLIPLADARERALLELARSQGASPWRAFWHVEWPRWRLPVWSAMAWVSAASLGEVAAVSFFSSERLVTLPLVVSRWMATYQFEQAYAVTAVLMVLSVLLALGRRIFGA